MKFSDTSGARRVRLREGSRIVIRPIRADDGEALHAFVIGLSPTSRSMRGFRPNPAKQIERLTHVDHHLHEELVAVDPSSNRVIGLAGYAISRDHPAEADVGLVVADAWQRRGVGTALVDRLAREAREHGVRHFTALVEMGNDPAEALLLRVGADRTGSGAQQSDWVVEIGPPRRRSLRWPRALPFRRRSGADPKAPSSGG